MCTSVCRKMHQTTKTIQGCIEEACSSICGKIKELHECFKAHLGEAYTQVCNKLKNDVCSKLQAALNAVKDYVKTCFKQICTCIENCIDAVCGKDCTCECCEKKVYEKCCNSENSENTRCKCTNPNCVCLKCCVITMSCKLCENIKKGSSQCQDGVKASCKGICGWVDSMYKLFIFKLHLLLIEYDTFSVINKLLSFFGGNNQIDTNIAKALGTVYSKITAALEKLCKCAGNGCQCCTKNSVDCCDNLQTCNCPDGKKCLCLKCVVIRTSSAICGKITGVEKTFTTPIQTACQNICKKIDNIHKKCAGFFNNGEGAKKQIEKACPAIALSFNNQNITEVITGACTCADKLTENCDKVCQESQPTQNDCSNCTENTPNGGKDNCEEADKTKTIDTQKGGDVKGDITRNIQEYARHTIESACDYAISAAESLKDACAAADNINTKLKAINNLSKDLFNDLGKFNQHAKIETDSDAKETRDQTELLIIKCMYTIVQRIHYVINVQQETIFIYISQGSM